MGICHGKPIEQQSKQSTSVSSDQTPAAKSSGFPFYSPSPLPSLFKPSPASASSTPLRIFKRPFPPPSPAKHIRAFLARCNGSTNKPNEVTIPGNSGRWLPSPGPLSHQFEAESFSSSRDLGSANQVSSRRLSFSSSFSDGDHSFRRGGGGFEHAYSFVGMHCIFDQCKSSVTVLKFGHMSSDLLAYGASDGTLTVCSLSQEPSVLKQLTGHSKDVTVGNCKEIICNRYISYGLHIE
ncbi:hypothetical protein YC2023_064133 [Brassica napus]